MKMKLKVAKKVSEEVEVDVQFPIFRRMDYGSDSGDHKVYQMIMAEGKTSGTNLIPHIVYEITKRSSWTSKRVTWELETNRYGAFNEKDPVDYILGQGEWHCTEQEFFEALNEFKDFVNKVPVVWPVNDEKTIGA